MAQLYSGISSEVVTYKQKYHWPIDTMRYAIRTKGTPRFFVDSLFESYLSDAERNKRIKESLKKIEYARQYNYFWSKLSWVQLVFITGSTASLNALENHDIDLWVIVNPRRIWITRFLDWIVFSVHGARRMKDTEDVTDKFCINFYKTTDNMKLSTQDCAFAMQCVDSVLIYANDLSRYRELLVKNMWIAQYFPAWYEQSVRVFMKIKVTRNKALPSIKSFLLDIADFWLGFMQLLKKNKRLPLPSEIYANEFTTWRTHSSLS